MRLRKLIVTGSMAGLLAVAGGCQSLYNGAWTLSSQDEDSIKAYHDFKQERDKQARVNELRTTEPRFDQTGAPGSRVTPNDPARTAADATPNTSNNPSAGAQSQTNAVSFEAGPAVFGQTASTGGMRPLNLYGQLPIEQPQRSSPLDSPDNLRRVSFASEGADFDPTLDPTGQYLVFASTRHRPTSDLYLAKVGSTTVTQLTDDPGDDVMPSISPDGKRVAFASNRAGNWDIYIMDMAGGQAQQLTNDTTQDVHPSFSPDGTKLVYSTYGAQSGQWELVVIDIDHPAAKRFIGTGLFPQWSPVDNRILFQRARERGTRWFSVWTVDYTNGEGLHPTEVAASANAAAITPNWSPDGKWIVFSTVINPDASEQTTPVQADVWMVASDGSSRLNLTNSRFTNLQPVWAKDGSIYFVSNRGKDSIDNIWSVRPDRAVALAQRNASGEAFAQKPEQATPTSPTPPQQASVPTDTPQ